MLANGCRCLNLELAVSLAVSLAISYMLAQRRTSDFALRRRSDIGAIQASHITDVPRLGGAAVFFGYLAALPINGFELFGAALAASGLFVFVVGLSEDISGNVSALRRLAASMLAACAAISFSGVRIVRVDLDAIDGILNTLPLAAMALTVLFAAAYTHAFNIIDGMNGLSSVVGISTAVGLALLAGEHGQPGLADSSAILAAAILGFLFFNWPRARLFLGDGGAYIIGHLLFWTAIMLSVSVPDISVSALILIMFWPTAELTTTIIRRALIRAPLAHPDRMHTHQLVRTGIERLAGMSQYRPMANSLATVCILPAAVLPPLLGVVFNNDGRSATLALLGLSVLYSLTYVALLVTTPNYGRIR